MKEFSILSIPDWLFLSRPRLENSMLSFAEMRLVPSTNEAFFYGGGVEMGDEGKKRKQ